MKGDRLIDAHLRQALAHAPDAELGAPAHVSAQIIAAAHRAVAQLPPQPAAPGWRRWWSGRPARWGSSGALASLLMAGFLGWMWQGGVPEPEAQMPALGVIAENTPAPASAAAPAPAPAAPEPRAAAAADAAKTLRDTERRQQMQQARRAQKEDSARQRLAEAAPPAAATAALAAQAELRADSAARSMRLAPAPAPAPAAAPPATRLNLQRAAPAANALAPMAPPLQPPPQALHWQLDGGPSVPAQPAWLQALAQRTQGRWLEAASAPPAGSIVLRLLGDDMASSTLWLGTDTLWWCNDQMRCLQATPGEATLVALKKELPR